MQSARNVLNNKILWAAIMILLTVFLMYRVFHLWEMDNNVPIVDNGDAVGSMALGYEALYGKPPASQLFAPYSEPERALISFAPVHLFVAKIVAIFAHTPGAVANFTYFMGYIMVALSCYIFLIQLKVHPAIASFGGVIYSFLPYHYLRYAHLTLANYFIVPLLCLGAYWLVHGRLFQNITNPLGKAQYTVNWKYTGILWGIFALSALTELYYSIFGMILTAFAVLIYLLHSKKYHTIWVFACGVGICGLFIMLSNWNYIIKMLGLVGGNFENVLITRDPTDIERYSLRISEMIFPIDGHRFHLFNVLRTVLNQRLLTLNESSTATLGSIMTIGFFASIFFSIIYVPNINKRDTLRQFGCLNIALVLVGTIGGFANVIGFITHIIRAYNRISIFIAVFSIATVAILLDFLLRKIKNRGFQAMCCLLLIPLSILGVWDQTPYQGIGSYSTTIKRQHELQAFVRKIERTVGSNEMIYQLPVVRESGNMVIQNMDAYAMVWPALYSDNLRWSFAQTYDQFNPSLQFQDKLNFLSGRNMLDNLCYAGFSGIYIDKYAYTDEQYRILSEEFNRHLGGASIVSLSGRWEFYNLSGYAKKLIDEKGGSWDALKVEALKYSEPNEQIEYYTYNHIHIGILGNAQQVFNGVILAPGDIQFGPYEYTCEPGIYKITVCGEGLTGTEINVRNPQKEFAVDMITWQDSEISYVVEIDAHSPSMEFILRNISDHDIVFRGVILERT